MHRIEILRPVIQWIVPLFLTLMLMADGCMDRKHPADDSMVILEKTPEIFPDYNDITIPLNIAPLNFQLKEPGERFLAILEGGDGKSIRLQNDKKTVRIPSKKWNRFIMENRGSEFKIRIFMKDQNNWKEYAPIVNHIALEPIDPFLAYRLIPPGYETWSSMGLYQRDLTSFREDPIIENKTIEGNCVNCHSFCNGSSENMMFHIRGSLGGTVIKKGDFFEKVNLKREETLSAGVYPSWHPSGNYIAFSTNKIEQYFHAKPGNTIEVIDRQSDLILYNTITHEVAHVPGTEGDRYLETFPNWSPDGNFLYFSRTDAGSETPFDSVRYDIYRIAFDPQNAKFGETEPVFVVSSINRSASFPRVSPDGKYLLCTVHNYGTFPIWHKEADLCLVDLRTGESEFPGKVNSDQSDSFHSWSSNSRWIVFSSRRFDGLYTKLYISHMDEDGRFQKPFLLPQRQPGFYNKFFYSYNVPELVTDQIKVHPRKWKSIDIRREHENSDGEMPDMPYNIKGNR